jgi:hypothetical protein
LLAPHPSSPRLRPDLGALPWGTCFNAGAFIAALIVAYVSDGLAGLKQIGVRLIRWRVNWIWYILALGVPLLVNAATTGLTVATGAPALKAGSTPGRACRSRSGSS